MDDLISRQAAIEAIDNLASDLHGRGRLDEEYIASWSAEIIEQLPSVQPEIIRCKDCRFYPNHGHKKDVVFDADACHWNADEMPDPDDYCSAAERRKE